MANNVEELRKKVDELKKHLAGLKDAKKNDPKAREARKSLKRAQRRLALISPKALEDRLKNNQKVLDLISKTLSEMTKGAKKVVGNPYVHSLRKKTKSYNKRIKKLNRLIEKKKADNPSADAKPS